jgi:hypothetical protein
LPNSIVVFLKIGFLKSVSLVGSNIIKKKERRSCGAGAVYFGGDRTAIWLNMEDY